MKEHPDKRYVVEIYKLHSVDVLMQQMKYVTAVVRDNYTIKCRTLNDFFVVKKHGYNCFLDQPVADWETFNLFQQAGMTDIYIDGPLGFDMETIFAKKKNTKIRVSPTISPNARFIYKTRSECSFYIRPEDIKSEYYNEVIDIIDFSVLEQEQEDALFNIYNDGVFMSDINKLIPGLRPGVSNILLDPQGDIPRVRSNCKQRCQSGGRCHYCTLSFNLAENMHKLKHEL